MLRALTPIPANKDGRNKDSSARADSKGAELVPSNDRAFCHSPVQLDSLISQEISPLFLQAEKGDAAR